MKQLAFFLLLIISVTGSAYAQVESPESQYSVSKFKTHYNLDQQDSIYNMLTAEAKVKLPFEKMKPVMAQLQGNYGKINQLKFINYQGGFAVYRADLEKGIIQLGISTNQDKAVTGLHVKPYEAVAPEIQKRNTSRMQLPFSGEWTVFWGGDTKEQNYHVVAKMQKNAFDIVITNTAGKNYKTDGRSNVDYYAFGQNLNAPCDAEVVFAVDGVKDNIPGKMNTMLTLGNSILLKTVHNEYILFAHFKQGSIKVKQGDKVKSGQFLGQCGNSGNSSEPHLHFHIQDAEDFNQADGIKCFFKEIKVNGVTKSDYSPVKGDKISS